MGFGRFRLNYSCGLWEISINSSKDSTHSWEGCKLEADEWAFWELLLILISLTGLASQIFFLHRQQQKLRKTTKAISTSWII